MQPKLVHLATDTDDNDEAIGDILKTNDTCEVVLKKYKSLVEQGNSFNSNLPVDDALVSLSITNDSTENSFPLNSNGNNALDELKDLFSTSSNIQTNSTKSANDLNSFYEDLLSIDSKPFVSTNTFINTGFSPLQPVVIKPKELETSNLFLF